MKINIMKESIPYITEITIAGTTFQFEFTYNSYDKRVYIFIVFRYIFLEIQ